MSHHPYATISTSDEPQPEQQQQQQHQDVQRALLASHGIEPAAPDFFESFSRVVDALTKPVAQVVAQVATGVAVSADDVALAADLDRYINQVVVDRHALFAGAFKSSRRPPKRAAHESQHS